MKKIIIALIIVSMALSAGCTEREEEYTAPEPTEEIRADADDIDFTAYEALPTKVVSWGIRKMVGEEPEVPLPQQQLLESYNGFYMDKSNPKCLYLTFDEGYENGYTAKILDVLAEKNVPAAFFVTGPYLKQQPELVNRMLNEGHIVGNHTVNHPNLAKLSPKEAAEDICGLDDMFYELYNRHMHYLRPPEGTYSEQTLSLAEDLGYRTILWSFAYKDWDTKDQRGTDYAYEQTVKYLHNGAIILLHAVSSDNAGALSEIIDYAIQQGYEFKSLDNLDNNQ